VVENGELTRVTARYVATTGDTMIDGRPFSEVHPATEGYAADAAWFIANEPLVLGGFRYVKYGAPRVLLPHELVRAREYRGVPLFAEPPGGDRPPVVYVPVRPGCVFQSYQDLLEMRGVRG
jgi:hypothetical protein